MVGCIAHERNGHISTSGLKSVVTFVFLDPDFLKNAKIAATNKGHKGHAVFILHARNCHISTSDLTSDVTIVLPRPNFLKYAKISAIRVHLRQI